VISQEKSYELPFDLSGKRILTYQVARESDNKSAEKYALASKLTDAILEFQTRT